MPIGFFQTRTATAPSGTTYHQINDSTYTWSTPSGSRGTFQQYPVSGQSPTGTYVQYWGAGMADEELPIQDTRILDAHDNNVETLKAQGAFDEKSGYQKMKDRLKTKKDKLKAQGKARWNSWVQEHLLFRNNGGELNYLNMF